MKIIFAFLSLMIAFSGLEAQSICDGNYYVNEIFDHAHDQNIQYGQNTTVAGSQQDLYMDVFYPSNDSGEKRPLLVLAHGGSFFSGTRSELNQMCISYAKKGYVAATISYRLFDLFVIDSTLLIKEVLYAVSDMKAATRFFVEDAATTNQYNVDTSAIFMGGVSAGAIVANHAAYLDANDSIPAYISTQIQASGGFSGNSSTNTQYNFTVKGVINLSGALLDANWVSNQSIPMYSVHEEFDPTVPCNLGVPLGNLPFFPDIETQGSCSIEALLTNASVPNQFWLIEGSNDHTNYLFDSRLFTVFSESSLFLQQVMCGFPPASTGNSSTQKNTAIFPNPALGFTQIESKEFIGETLLLLNMQGEILLTLPVTKVQTTLNLKDIAPGMYVLTTQHGSGLGKLVVK